MQSEIVFSKSIQVIRKDLNGRSSSLTFDISTEFQGASGPHAKELHVRLTSVDDLFFLQSLRLNDEDFQSLKQQQGLLVDFSAFPKKFVDLLETCITEGKNAEPRFLLHFSAGVGMSTASQGCLEIIETNPFKHLVHLTLKFIPGNSEEVKTYLVSCLKQLKEENLLIVEREQTTASSLSSRLASAQQVIDERTKEMLNLREEMKHQLEQTQTSLSRELQTERENYRKLQESYEQKRRTESQNSEEQYRSAVENYEVRIKEYDAANKELTDQKYKYESLIRDLKSKVANLEEERRMISKDVIHLRRQNTNLDSERHERDKTLNHLRTRIAVLEQELKDKEHDVTQTNRLLKTSNEQKERLKFDLEEKLTSVSQLEVTLRSVSSEVHKGNEIIQKLQKELKATKSKLKMMGLVTAKQEKLLEEKETVFAQKEKELSETKQLLSGLQDENNRVKVSVSDVTQKLNESREELKNNENVINWLNKQLNEQTVNKLSSTHNASAFPSSRVSYSGRTTIADSSNNPNIVQSSQNNPTRFNAMNYLPKSQVGYRPILKKPQFQADGISPIMPQDRHPLREKQMSTPADRFTDQLEPKYLMRKKPEAENQENNRGPRPLVVSSQLTN